MAKVISNLPCYLEHRKNVAKADQEIPFIQKGQKTLRNIVISYAMNAVHIKY